MQAMRMRDRERGNQKSSLFLQPLKVPRIIFPRPKLSCVGGMHHAYAEMDTKIIEERPPSILDGGWVDSCLIQIPERIQELNKASHVVPQLSSHGKVIKMVPTGMHHAYKEMDTKIIEERPPSILDGGWIDSFSIQIPESIQELKKALYVVPQLSSHGKVIKMVPTGMHHPYKEMDTKIIEERPPSILDGGWIDSCLIQIPERIQELNKASHVVPQLSSHGKVIKMVPTGMHHTYKEMDTKIIEERPPSILDGGWIDSFSIQIPESIQELKKALYVVPQLSSHGKVIKMVPTGMHHTYKEMDTKIIEERPPSILDGGWIDSFSIQIPESIQELKKALYVVPQLSSHPKPGCFGGLFSSLDKLLQRITPRCHQTKKVEEWSWRLAQLNILPEVRSQGHFETCVFFAVIGAVEGRYRLHVIRKDPDHATVPQLSVQDAIDGIKQVPIDPATCFNWIIKQGLVPEFDCRYIGVPQGGHVLKEGRLSVVNGYRFINPGGERAEGIVEEIMKGGPIVGIISYKSKYLHAVMLIGGVYKDDLVDAYVIQNSWGTGWEEDGRGLVPISYLVEAYVPVLG
ncbi:hypothetical protein POTOM_007018 [Populus tomentosa]|uniref:Peptidase C1A papain C-terminal domain-containing protein n=1 Tax=Populus tomentosa TaxID=118781 RepID=A0A8X8DG36_POPTO|nr:hypothetical protein POTOM_007018 [Populus tomentosa]